MSQMIETLEQRTLMSVTADTLTADEQLVFADAKAAIVAHNARVATSVADDRAIAVDLREASTRFDRLENLRLFLKLDHDGIVSHAAILRGLNGLLRTARFAALAGLIDGKGLLLHPTSDLLQKRVAQLETYANTNVPGWLTYLQTQITNGTNTISADGAEIADVNPSIAGAITTAGDNLAAKTTALNEAATKVQTDMAQLTSDLAAISTT